MRRTEAKAFFANERTFLHWMNMSVTIGSISAALLDYEGHAIFVRSISLVLMVLSIFMAVYAAWSFNNRGEMLQAKMDGPYDSRLLPVLLAVILMVALLIVFSGAVAETAGWT
ncbi:hypothetical protein WJX75_002340 [Coccomyxa subellipsoidea]|uniref:DUF202 domain-containing protein n=1 Tax=Coccomyxa subellipsoidea TaxID=248742 RepID=A0ABR2Z2P1_9CHLO